MATISDRPKAEASNSTDDLKTVLTAFETSLLTPTVSGELAPWLEEVQKTNGEIARAVRETNSYAGRE